MGELHRALSRVGERRRGAAGCGGRATAGAVERLELEVVGVRCGSCSQTGRQRGDGHVHVRLSIHADIGDDAGTESEFDDFVSLRCSNRTSACAMAGTSTRPTPSPFHLRQLTFSLDDLTRLSASELCLVTFHGSAQDAHVSRAFSLYFRQRELARTHPASVADDLARIPLDFPCQPLPTLSSEQLAIIASGFHPDGDQYIHAATREFVRRREKELSRDKEQELARGLVWKAASPSVVKPTVTPTVTPAVVPLVTPRAAPVVAPIAVPVVAPAVVALRVPLPARPVTTSVVAPAIAPVVTPAFPVPAPLPAPIPVSFPISDKIPPAAYPFVHVLRLGNLPARTIHTPKLLREVLKGAIPPIAAVLLVPSPANEFVRTGFVAYASFDTRTAAQHATIGLVIDRFLLEVEICDTEEARFRWEDFSASFVQYLLWKTAAAAVPAILAPSSVAELVIAARPAVAQPAPLLPSSLRPPSSPIAPRTTVARHPSHGPPLASNLTTGREIPTIMRSSATPAPAAEVRPTPSTSRLAPAPVVAPRSKNVAFEAAQEMDKLRDVDGQLLPPGWIRAVSSKSNAGEYYYWHEATSTTQWLSPLASQEDVAALAEQEAAEAIALKTEEEESKVLAQKAAQASEEAKLAEAKARDEKLERLEAKAKQEAAQQVQKALALARVEKSAQTSTHDTTVKIKNTAKNRVARSRSTSASGTTPSSSNSPVSSTNAQESRPPSTFFHTSIPGGTPPFPNEHNPSLLDRLGTTREANSLLLASSSPVVESRPVAGGKAAKILKPAYQDGHVPLAVRLGESSRGHAPGVATRGGRGGTSTGRGGVDSIKLTRSGSDPSRSTRGGASLVDRLSSTKRPEPPHDYIPTVGNKKTRGGGNHRDRL